MASDTVRRMQQLHPFTPEVFIEYLNDTKKIAGLDCKKAIIRYTTRRGEDMAQEVWYSPDFKMDENIQMGEVLRMANVPGLQKLKGFPMEFLMKRPNGSTSHYMVTKVDLKAKVDDKVFAIFNCIIPSCTTSWAKADTVTASMHNTRVRLLSNIMCFVFPKLQAALCPFDTIGGI